jgi:hypothetical protein
MWGLGALVVTTTFGPVAAAWRLDGVDAAAVDRANADRSEAKRLFIRQAHWSFPEIIGAKVF